MYQKYKSLFIVKEKKENRNTIMSMIKSVNETKTTLLSISKENSINSISVEGNEIKKSNLMIENTGSSVKSETTSGDVSIYITKDKKGIDHNFEIYTMANELYNKFIKPDSVFELNLSDGIIKNIKKDLAALSETFESNDLNIQLIHDPKSEMLFDTAYKEVLNSILLNIYIPYFTTKA